MELRYHPRHSRNTLLSVFVTVVGVLLSSATILDGWLTPYLGDWLKHPLLLKLYAFCGVFIMIVGVASSLVHFFFLKCDSCGKWLCGGTVSDQETQNFTCHSCGITWDTGVVVSDD